MRQFVGVFILMLFINSGLNGSDNNIKVYEGIAQRSKAGLVVAGVMITCLSEEEMDRYEGKKVKVRGLVQSDHRWKIDESEPVKRQGFNMPVMHKVLSIEIIAN